MMKELLPEIWTTVFKNLVKPLPNRKSCLDDRVERIDQDDLASVMRVSKLFHTLAAPILYEVVVVDDLTSFFHNAGKRIPIRGFPSKTELLQHTRRLYFEYPTGLPAGTERHFKRFHVQPDIATIFPEISTVIQAYDLLVGPNAISLSKLMPNLQHFASGGLLGQSDHVWTAIFGPNVTLAKACRKIQEAMAKAVMESRIETFCQSGNMGPINLHPVALHTVPAGYSNCKSIRDTPLKFTAHITLEKECDVDKTWDNLCVGPNMEATWCFDNYSVDIDGPIMNLMNKDSQPTVANNLQVSFRVSMASRHESLPKNKASRVLRPLKAVAYIPFDPLFVQKSAIHNAVIIPPGSNSKQANTIRREALAQRIDKFLRDNLGSFDMSEPGFVGIVHPNDRLAVHTIDLAPACPSCDWTPVMNRKAQ